MVPVYVAKQEKLKMVNEVEEENVKFSFSNIQIDPNSTRSVNFTQEKQSVLTPEEEEDSKSKSKGSVFSSPL